MNASLFSWSGLIITLLVVVVILATVVFAVRGVVRFIHRRRQQRAKVPSSRGM